MCMTCRVLKAREKCARGTEMHGDTWQPQARRRAEDQRGRRRVSRHPADTFHRCHPQTMVLLNPHAWSLKHVAAKAVEDRLLKVSSPNPRFISSYFNILNRNRRF